TACAAWPRPTPGFASRFHAVGEGSSLESQRDAPDGDLVAEAHAFALLDLHAVHQRAVRAAEVLDPPFVIALLEDRVPGGRRLIGDRDVVARVASDRVRRAQREALPHAWRLRRAALDDERPERARLRTLRRERALERRERTEEEQVEK